MTSPLERCTPSEYQTLKTMEATFEQAQREFDRQSKALSIAVTELKQYISYLQRKYQHREGEPK